MTPMALQVHPYARIFPLLEGAEFSEFVEDIRRHGLHEQIVLLGDQLLDGRNRSAALNFLAESGEVLGEGWGHRAGEPLDPEMLVPSADNFLFRKFIPEKDGADPFDWVWSKNFRRRQLNKSQTALALSEREKFRHGGNRRSGQPDQDAQVPLDRIAETRADLAEEGNVSERYLTKAAVVRDHGVDDLKNAVRQGHLTISGAEPIARLPEVEQPAALEKVLPNGHRAIMGSRHEPDDSLDYFPTPPWATRALIERVFRHGFNGAGLPFIEMRSVWEPACGEGHIAEVLEEYFDDVSATDIYDYGYGLTSDFLDDANGAFADKIDWIITNPPFSNKSEAFVLRALERAAVGVAMFVRLQWLETNGRYERIFRDHPPTLISFFAERVNLCKGRWEPEGTTATAYIWLVWIKGEAPRAPFWIAPDCREALTRADDVARFTAHPVLRKDHSQAKAGVRAVLGNEPPGLKPPAGRVSDGRTSDGDAAASNAASPGFAVAPIARACCDLPDRPHPLDIPDFLRRRADNTLPFAKVTA